MPKVISRAEAIKQGLKHYFTGKPCKNGHVAKRYCSSKLCFICSHEKSIKRNQYYWKTEKGKLAKAKAQAKYFKKNREELLTKAKERKETPKGKKANQEAQAKYWKENREKLLTKAKERKETPKGKIAYKEAQTKYFSSDKAKEMRKKWLEKYPEQKIAMQMRRNLYSIFRKNDFKKKGKFLELVGCDSLYLKNYLEKKFKSGMNWNNYGRGNWHVDHIVPVQYFIENYDYNKLETQKICWSYLNLQPMWEKDNISKSNKISKQVAEKKIAEIKKLINA